MTVLLEHIDRFTQHSNHGLRGTQPASLAALETWGNTRPSDPRLPELVHGLGVTLAGCRSPGQLFASLSEFAEAIRVNQDPRS